LEGGAERLRRLRRSTVVWAPEFARAGWLPTVAHSAGELREEYIGSTIEA